MFAMSAFLGAGMTPDHALAGALIAVIGIFLPGFLLILSFHDTWETLAQKPGAAGAVAGVNASVVGLLLAALYQPVFVNAVFRPWTSPSLSSGFFCSGRCACRSWRWSPSLPRRGSWRPSWGDGITKPVFLVYIG